MTAFNHGDTHKARFDLAGFKFEKEVTFLTDHSLLKIRCVNTDFEIINREITDFDDWYTQIYGIALELNQYIIDYMPEEERIFAHLTSHMMNHELID